MARLQAGKYNKHVNESYGPDNNIMKFYTTQYSSSHGLDGFKPKYGHHSGTGYNSNFRTGVYYSRKLDELDNPFVGQLVSDNYCSLTHKDYIGCKGSNGKDPLPNSLIQPLSSGYLKGCPKTIPHYQQQSAMLQNKPLLHTLKNKHPIKNEYDNQSSEYHSEYLKKNQHIDTHGKTLAGSTDTGYTRSKNLEPLTYRSNNNFDSPYTEYSTYRPVGNSVTQTSYQAALHPMGNEALPHLNEKSNVDTGFTRYIQPTAAHTAADGKQISTGANFPSNITQQNPFNRLPRDIPGNLGEKEDTGYIRNNKSYTLDPSVSPYKGNTIYANEYVNKMKPFDPWSMRSKNLNELLPNGYTKSEKLHPSPKIDDVSKQLQSLRPYVNRSLKARDPFYGERIYEHKKKPLIIA